MSELIQKNNNRATIRWQLLTGVSALALAVSSASTARAEDTDHPLLWLELGGQMEQVQGISSPYTAPFMATTPAPDSYSADIFSSNQRPPRFAFGVEGSLSFQPEDSNWIFSAAIRYGRAHTNRHEHEQGTPAVAYWYSPFQHIPVPSFPLYAAPLADVQMRQDEKHTILDFSAGKDVGLGMFGGSGESVISAGVRFVQFSSKSDTDILARPSIGHITHPTFFKLPWVTFDQYSITGHAQRSFKGVGPSLSWKASAPIAGNPENGELSLDWGVNGALLFGRQKAKVDHKTKDSQLTQSYCTYPYTSSGISYCGGYTSRYQSRYPARDRHQRRSKSVMVPNLGGFAGLTARYRDAKVSIGYRVDMFFGAMDTGIDARKNSNLTFNGPYASISIGLGD